MASGSSASLPSLHSTVSPSPSVSSSTTSAPTTADSDASLSNTPPLSREVRFDERCVLIPERSPSRSPHRLRTGTLEVNLPFTWKWPVLGSPSPREKYFPTERSESKVESGEGVPGAGLSESPPKSHANHIGHEAPPQHVVLKLPYPIFRRKSHSPTQSSVVLPPSCLRHPTSPPSSARSATFRHRNMSPDANRSPSSGPRKPKRRSASLPALPLDQSVETIPLRPCCEKCLAASDVHWNRKLHHRTRLLPTLQESSREHTPSQSRLDLREEGEEEEDWCAGLHFTKGALKLWRSASTERTGAMHTRIHALRQFQEGPSGGASGKLLDSLVRVDEVDKKRGSSPSASATALATEDEVDAQERDAMLVNMPDLERVKRADQFDPPSPCGSGSENESEEDLFPLPSPKRLSPAASPTDSATCLPAQIAGFGSEGKPFPTEARQFEAVIREKMAEKEKEVEKAKARAQATVSASAAFSASIVSSNPPKSLRASASAGSAPIPIPGTHMKEGVSHFQSNLDEIEWDPSLPDPDALPPNSTILLNSPPGSPILGAGASNGGEKHARLVSVSPPSLPHIQIPRPHIPDVRLPLSPKKKRGPGPGNNPTLPAPASASASTSIPGIYVPSSPPSTHPSAPVPPKGSSPPAMHALTQTRSNAETKTSPASPPVTRRRASVTSVMRASVGALRGLATTTSVSAGSDAAGGVSYSRGLTV